MRLKSANRLGVLLGETGAKWVILIFDTLLLKFNYLGAVFQMGTENDSNEKEIGKRIKVPFQLKHCLIQHYLKL